VEGAATDRYAGEPWDVPKLYWTVTDAAALEAASGAIAEVPAGWRRPEAGELSAVDPATVTTALDVRGVFDAKRAALRAHATQVTVAPSGTEFALSNDIVQPISSVEHFVLVRGTLGPTGPDGRETDLFAGLPV
jgi:N-acetyl-1-D-myo-inositol-2-amino-2-deoxy-alpha-D-glucopyranoside deacetylase